MTYQQVFCNANRDTILLLNLDPSLLKPNPWNTNIMSPDSEDKLDESVRRNGMFKPIIVRELADGAYEILGGEHRAQSAVRVGLDTVPVWSVGKIEDTKAKEIGVIDNGRYGADDTLALGQLLEELGTSDELATFLPFSDTELTAIFSAASIELDDLDIQDDDAPATAAPAAKTHTIQRYKLPLEDAERVSELIEATMKSQGFTESDALTNAGDALVYLLFNKS